MRTCGRLAGFTVLSSLVGIQRPATDPQWLQTTCGGNMGILQHGFLGCEERIRLTRIDPIK
ncbi:hypothetical protein KIN20_011946 [Parelaphostrongylus tenuis]|uniref:Uncharacterized protein n=1 Tax=Parelaphostrongylus tenuis TaxID=148309 RepID=A0AAD5MA63_PARTN|nr:hypothetical protein KIN20_011946 [Parelaphostrongylus tenuis]